MVAELRQSKATKMAATQEWSIVSTSDILEFIWQKPQMSLGLLLDTMTVPFVLVFNCVCQTAPMNDFGHQELITLFVALIG